MDEHRYGCYNDVEDDRGVAEKVALIEFSEVSFGQIFVQSD